MIMYHEMVWLVAVYIKAYTAQGQKVAGQVCVCVCVCEAELIGTAICRCVVSTQNGRHVRPAITVYTASCQSPHFDVVCGFAA